MAMASSSFQLESKIRGYHVYKDIWVAVDGEVLGCRRETSNGHDPFAVAVVKDSTVVGHVPRRISAICSLFLRRHGTITCRVNGSRRYSRDLPQGGLEVPCILIFSGEAVLVDKVKNLIDDINKEEGDSKASITSPDSEPPCKKTKVSDNEKSSEEEWMRLDRIVLKIADKETITKGAELHDLHIEMYQKLLKIQFPNLMGLSSSLKVLPMGSWTDNYVQVYHCRSNHWITVSTLGCKDGEINVYDSMYTSIDSGIIQKIEDTFPDSDLTVALCPVQRQIGMKDCGLFALAFATSLAFGNSPQSLSLCQFNQNSFREHYVSSIQIKQASEFPHHAC